MIPFTLELLALRRLTTAAFGTLMSLEPAFGMVVGFLVLHQVPGVPGLVGICLVVAAGIGAARSGARTPVPSTSPDASTLRQMAAKRLSDNAFVRVFNALAVKLMDVPVVGGLVRRGMVEIRYVGRKSGKTFSTPVAYRRSGEDDRHPGRHGPTASPGGATSSVRVARSPSSDSMGGTAPVMRWRHATIAAASRCAWASTL